MKKNLNTAEQLKKKYHKTEEVTNLKDMLYRSGTLYCSRTAFKIKDNEGKIKTITYEQFKNDVVYLGTSLIKNGFLNKRIAVIGKNTYNWCVSYMAATIVGIVVPIDKELHTDDVINFINVSQAECILGDSKNLNKVLEDMSKVQNKNTMFITFEDHFDNFKEERKISLSKWIY